MQEKILHHSTTHRYKYNKGDNTMPAHTTCKSYQKYKHLHSISNERVQTKTSCAINVNTGHITIYTTFGKTQSLYKSNARQKHLHSMSCDGVRIKTTCMINTNTNHITISTSSAKHGNWKGGAITNPSCATYLGVVVAENVLAKVFKNVKRMPTANIGYDFICGKGYKVDVKAACLNVDNRFAFCINKNLTADYFLCAAFDNRTELNPQHIWLIPAHMASRLTMLSIAKSSVYRWAEYELTDKLSEVVKCCNASRNK